MGQALVYWMGEDVLSDVATCRRLNVERHVLYNDLTRAASPAGGWIVLPTSNLTDTTTYYIHADVQLDLVHLPDCQRRTISNLLSPTIQQQVMKGDAPTAIFAVRGGLPGRWSPDGRTLAFVAALEGDTADLYTYQLGDGRLRRQTAGPSHVLDFWWSPDSRWLVAQLGLPSRPHFDPSLQSVYAVTADGSSIKKLYDLYAVTLGESFDGWLTTSTFVVHGITAPQKISLRAVDVNSGLVTPLSEMVGEDVAVDARSGTVALALREDAPSGRPGVYFVALGGAVQRVYGAGARALLWSAALNRFVCETKSDGVLAMAPSGQFISFEKETIYSSYAIAIAPDGSELAFGDFTDAAVQARGDKAGIRVYAANGQKQTELFTGKAVNQLAFSPDGRVLAYTLAESRGGYYVLRAGESQPMHVDLSDSVRAFGWVGTQ
jgi:dipeptidyl aminopeptidase/acylaminoacyl peptidase